MGGGLCGGPWGFFPVPFSLPLALFRRFLCFRAMLTAEYMALGSGPSMALTDCQSYTCIYCTVLLTHSLPLYVASTLYLLSS